MLWRRGSDEFAERCRKCGKPIVGLKRHGLRATPVFHPECLPKRPAKR